MAKYLLRFDDINPRMNWDKFLAIKDILEENNIKAILGVIPDCRDTEFLNFKENKSFISLLIKYKNYGDRIAQHGYQHIYDSKEKGFFGSDKKSEFAGLNYKKQFARIKKGKDILNKESLWEPIFMAPSHSFDVNTLKALKNLSFKYVLDGFSLNPFIMNNLIFIPQIFSKPIPKFIPGISQLCIHINTIKESDIKKLKDFILINKSEFITLEESLKYKKYNLYSIMDKLLINTFIRSFRSIRGIFKLISLKNIINKFRCIIERLRYKLLLHNQNIDPWHFKGTFECRIYKKFVYKLVEEYQPSLYIDIGCGLGDILSRIKLPPKNKIGFDIDKGLEESIKKIYKNKFIFFNNKKILFKHLSEINSEKKIIITMLNFCHNLSSEDLKSMLLKYQKCLGKYILIIDNIFIYAEEYKYNHHNFLYSHKGLIEYHDKIDNLRSLYVLNIG